MSTVSSFVDAFELKHTGTLDVSDDGTGLVVHELDTDLGDTTTRACRGLLVSNFRYLMVLHEPPLSQFCASTLRFRLSSSIHASLPFFPLPISFPDYSS